MSYKSLLSSLKAGISLAPEEKSRSSMKKYVIIEFIINFINYELLFAEYRIVEDCI